MVKAILTERTKAGALMSGLIPAWAAGRNIEQYRRPPWDQTRAAMGEAERIAGAGVRAGWCPAAGKSAGCASLRLVPDEDGRTLLRPAHSAKKRKATKDDTSA
jgi:hypothetical protein